MSRRRYKAKRRISPKVSTSQAGKKALLIRAASALAVSGRAAASVMERYQEVFLLAGLFGYGAVQSYRADRRMWFDELFSFHIARLPSIAEIFQAAHADGNPPLYALMARASMSLFGETEFAMRLPAILAFSAGLLATYCFVRRRSGSVLALMAMLALSVCYNAGYGSEARPYALLIAFTGLTLASWQAAAEGSRKALLGVALGIAGAVGSHHYGVLHVGLPLTFGELVRLATRRRFDLPLYGACAAGLSMLAFTAPLARESRRVMGDHVLESAVFWAKPSLQNIRSYEHMFVYWLPLVFAVLFLLTMAAYPRQDSSGDAHSEWRGVPPHETVAVVGLALLLPVMMGVAWYSTGYFVHRYAIGAAMGLAMLAGLAPQILRLNRSRAAAVASVCAALLGVQLALPLAKEAPAESESLLETAPGDEPIVIASALMYAPAWWYTSPRFRERLHYLADVEFAVRQPDFLPEVSLVANQAFLPSKVDDYRQFLASHRRFLLYCMGSPGLEWTKERLVAEGWQLKLINRRGSETLHLVEAPE